MVLSDHPAQSRAHNGRKHHELHPASGRRSTPMVRDSSIFGVQESTHTSEALDTFVLPLVPAVEFAELLPLPAETATVERTIGASPIEGGSNRNTE